MNSKYVFISYKSDEVEYVFDVEQRLAENGVYAWIDRNEIKPGDNYAERIDDGVKNASAVVVIFSTKAQTSIHIKSELDLALKYSKPIYAYVIEDCEKNEEFNFDLPPERRCEAFKNKDEAVFNMVSYLKDVIAADESDPYNVAEFFKNRRRYLKEQREQRNEEKPSKWKKPSDPNAPKKLYKKFPMNLTPYSKQYSGDKYTRLSLNIHTAFLIAAVIMMLTTIFGTLLSGDGYLYAALIVLSAFVLFIIGEAYAGLASYLIGKTKKYYAVLGLTIISLYIMFAFIIVVSGLYAGFLSSASNFFRLW